MAIPEESNLCGDKPSDRNKGFYTKTHAHTYPLFIPAFLITTKCNKNSKMIYNKNMSNEKQAITYKLCS